MKLFENWKLKIENYDKGFTLIETLVALAIFTASIISVVSVTASGVADTNFAKNKLIASYLAQEGIELVRNDRDTATLAPGFSWAIFWSEYKQTQTEPIGQFKREVTIGQNGDNEVQVTSKVEWKQGSATKFVEYTTSLFNWIIIQEITL